MRHATRASSFESDTALSPLGHSQAAAAPRLFGAGADGAFAADSRSGRDARAGNEIAFAPAALLAKPKQIFSSPKLRARQTVAPLAAALSLNNQVDERLDERHNEESRAGFEKRIRSFLELVVASMKTSGAGADSESGSSHVLLACSHMDWLEAVLPLMNSTMTERDLEQPWAAGEYRCFAWTPEEIWKLSHCGVLQGS